MKKVLSLVLALSLIVGIFSAVSFSAAGVSLDENKAYIKVNDNYYEVEKGESYTYTYYLSVPDVKISSFDAHTFYDTEGLDFVPTVDEYGDEDLVSMFPVLKSVVFNYTTTDGALYYNYSSTIGVRFSSEDSIAFTGKFLVTADKGIFEIRTNLVTLADSKMNKLKYDGVVYGDFAEKYDMDGLVPVPSETQGETQPSQDVTQPQATVATEPTEEITEPTEPTEPATTPSDIPTESETKATELPTAMPTTSNTVFIKADGVTYEAKQGDIITYVFNLSCSEKVAAVDAQTLYDANGLEFIPDVDDFGDYDLFTMFPVMKDVVANFKISGRIVFNFSYISGVTFPICDDSAYTEKNNVFVGKFKVTASTGVYEINSRIKTLGDMNAKKIIYNFEQVNDDIVVNQAGDIWGGTKPEPTNPTTPSEDITEPAEPATTPSEIPTQGETDPTVIPTEMPTTDVEPSILYGDVNDDGKINIFDVSHIQKNVAGYDGYELDERSFKAADVNFDTKINIFDASRIQKFIAGYFDSFN